MIRKIAAAVVVIALAALCWHTVVAMKCKRKNAELARRMEALNNEARERLPVGAGKADVEKFFDDHSMSHYALEPGRTYEGAAEIQGSRADEGGCAPFGCGADTIMLIMRVKMSAGGTVTEVPKAKYIYTDCL
jgi:hypothetical protein